MPDVLVRDLDAAVIDNLKSRAKDENRSLQAEMKLILSDAARRLSKRAQLERAKDIRDSILNRQQTDSAILLREDRDPMILVVDASVVVKWYVPEEFAAEADILAESRFDLHAPELILPEFGNIIWKKYRRGELTLTEADLIAASGVDREITYHPHEQLLETAINGALETGQTVYDWTYLSLALFLSALFVTADQRFYKALSSTKFAAHLIWLADADKLS